MAQDSTGSVLRAFGSAVRRRREALELSQERLAEVSELHRTYIGGIERGERNAGLVNITRLAVALDTSVADLLQDVDAVISARR